MNQYTPLMPPPKGKIAPKIVGLSRFLKRDINKTLSEYGLFPGQDHILMIISENEGFTPSQLASYLKVSLATVSVSIKRMEKSGFLEKKQDDDDARRSRLYLSKKSRSIIHEIKAHMDEQERLLTSKMTKDEQQLFEKLLDRAMKSICSEGGSADE